MARRLRLGRLPTTTVSRMLNGGTMLGRHQLWPFLEVRGVTAREHGDWLDVWQRAWNAQFHYSTTRFSQAARSGYRVVEYEWRVLHAGYRDYDLVKRSFHTRRNDASPLGGAERTAAARDLGDASDSGGPAELPCCPSPDRRGVWHLRRSCATGSQSQERIRTRPRHW
jgi:hypothetical protein